MKFKLSRDNPALYITIVAQSRLPIFQTDALKTVVCSALDQARTAGNFLLFAYVIMPDHLHLLTNQPQKSADVLRYLKGTIGHNVIAYLKEKGFQSSLDKLRHPDWKRNHRYTVTQQEKNVFSVFSEAMLMQKANYIHQNPVRAGLIARALDYRWSSARIWQRCESETEPLRLDWEQIEWRGA